MSETEIETPLLKSAKLVGAVATLAAAVTTAIGGVFFLDQRYAHAQELQSIKTESDAKLQSVKIDSEAKLRQVRVERRTQLQQLQVENRGLRQSMIEDKVFELELKPKRTQADEAQLNRYRRQLQVIDNEIKALQEQK